MFGKISTVITWRKRKVIEDITNLHRADIKSEANLLQY